MIALLVAAGAATISACGSPGHKSGALSGTQSDSGGGSGSNTDDAGGDLAMNDGSSNSGFFDAGPGRSDGGLLGAPGDAALLPDAAGLTTRAPDPCVEAGTCPLGVWTNVTPADMPATVLRPTSNAFGPGSIVADPAHPGDMYVGPNAGLWKSSDYGSTWTRINNSLQDAPRGVLIAVAGTTPATIWAAGYNVIYKSTDGGMTFLSTSINYALYSLKIDPYNNNHIISGLHEADGIVESTDGGSTWKLVGGTGWPSGGISWFPSFVDTGNATSTRLTWFAIAQNGASALMTTDGGAHWSVPNGISGLQHPHGCSQLFQNGSTLFVGGVSGPGQGVYRSTDLGMSWSRVDSGKWPEAVVWGTPKNAYAMYAWACSNCNLGTNYELAAAPGTTWVAGTVPSSLQIGPNSVAVAYDGFHYVFAAVMWDQGIWRYIEP